MIFEDLAKSCLKLVPPSIVILGYNLSLKVFLKITPSALGALGRGFESPRPDWLFSEGQTPPWEKIGKILIK